MFNFFKFNFIFFLFLFLAGSFFDQKEEQLSFSSSLYSNNKINSDKSSSVKLKISFIPTQIIYCLVEQFKPSCQFRRQEFKNSIKSIKNLTNYIQFSFFIINEKITYYSFINQNTFDKSYHYLFLNILAAKHHPPSF